MLTYFWRMGTYFYWGDESIYLLGEGMGRNLWGDNYPPSPLDLNPGLMEFCLSKYLNIIDIIFV